MLSRLLVVATTAALTVLVGCQTPTPNGFLPADKRDRSPYACPDESECYVQVQPYREQWLPEYIRVYKGKKLALWLNNDAVFEDPPVTLKPGEPPILDCSEKNKLIVKCKVSNDADTTRKYGYTIHVKGEPDYDPFVWPR